MLLVTETPKIRQDETLSSVVLTQNTDSKIFIAYCTR